MITRALRTLPVASMFLVVAGFAASAQQSQTWSDLDCSQSKIVAPAGLRCRATQEFSGSSSAKFSAVGAGQGVFRGWATYGTKDGVRLYYSVGQGVTTNSNQSISYTLEQQAKSSPYAKDARDFTPAAAMSGSDYLRFTSAAGEACAAIRKKGPVRGSGYAWVLVATKCVPKGKTISDQEIGEFIAAADFRA